MQLLQAQSCAELDACLQELAQEVAGQAKRCVLCLGHNKGWEEVTTSLAVRCRLLCRLQIDQCMLLKRLVV